MIATFAIYVCCCPPEDDGVCLDACGDDQLPAGVPVQPGLCFLLPLGARPTPGWQTRSKTCSAEAREVEDIKKPGRECTLDLDQDHPEQRLLDVSTSQPSAKPNLATCQRNVQ